MGVYIITTLFAIFVIGTLVHIGLLQVKLSRKLSRWPGLVIPVIWLAITIFVSFFFVYTPQDMREGNTWSDTSGLSPSQQQRAAEMEAFRSAMVTYHLIDYGTIDAFVVERTSLLMLALNIPTAMLIGLYFANRPQRNSRGHLQLIED